MDRKQFIKQTSLAGVGLSVMPFTAMQSYVQERSNPRLKKKVIVAGAGIAGLCCAYELMKLGHEVVVLEASGRYGGTVLSVHDGLSDGLYADFGAENFTKPGYENYWKYVEEFDLSVIQYFHRENRLTRRGDEWLTQEDISYQRNQEAKELGGFNKRELQFLSENPSASLEVLYLQPYLGNFKNEYQPFGVGYDDLDTVPISEIYKKEGASKAALEMLGGNQTSALYKMWQSYIMNKRGYWNELDLYRLKGGNETLTNEFAKRLGTRVQLDCQILAIDHGKNSVTVTYREFGEEKKMSADFLANCLPVPAIRNLTINPELPDEKRFIINEIAYEQKSRVVFQARSEFWKKDDTTINLSFNHPALTTIWQVAEEVDTSRVALMAKAPSGVSPLRTLETFKEFYPGDKSNIDIEQTLIKDWSVDRFAPGCERNGFPMGTLTKYWPHLILPYGRIHFAGGYADNRSWGMEAATNSANRVAKEIDQA